MSKKAAEPKAKPPNEKVEAAKRKLDEHVAVLAEQMRQGKSQALIRYLEVAAQFHSYSMGNIILAMWQRDDLSWLAGLRQWNRLGRFVRPGEKGIMILAPLVRTKRKKAPPDPLDLEVPEGPQIIIGFKPVYVFDVSQTEGKSLPAIVHATGDASGYYPALQEAIREAGIALEYAECVLGRYGVHGASFGGRIVMQEDLDPPEDFRCLVHEFAHELLHQKDTQESKTIRETEADATAFVVCRHFGIACNTSDYLILYHSDPKILFERMETIRQTAAAIIDKIDFLLPPQREPESAVECTVSR